MILAGAGPEGTPSIIIDGILRDPWPDSAALVSLVAELVRAKEN